MKRVFLFLIIGIFFGQRAKAQTDSLPANDPIISQIQALDFSQFVGQPVDTLLSHLPSGYTEIKILPSLVLKKAAFLQIKYAPGTAVIICVRNFNYMNPEFASTGTIDQNWSVRVFKKEVLSFAVAFNGMCFKGCENKDKIN
jgi:hypothetical protein